MPDFKAIRDFFFGIGLLTLILFGLLQSLLNRRMSKKERGFSAGLFAMQAICVCANLLLQYVDLTGGKPTLLRAAIFVQSLGCELMLLFFTGFLFSRLGLGTKNRLFLAVAVLGGVYLAILLASQWTTWFYYVTPGGGYYRGRFYLLLLLPPALSLLLDLAVLLLRRNRLTRLQFFSFLPVVCLPLLSVFFQSLAPTGPLVTYSMASAFIYLFACLFIEQARVSRLQQEEIDREHANNLVLQMRPHFIYNTMMSIYYLCAQDPKKAQQVILDFSSYLQKNFNALSEKDTIPFTEELEHTRAYLAVERTRFENQLMVELDTPCTQFRLPPLTLQPIVENAVKHGIDPEHEALHIRITTEETARSYVIRIQNDGAMYAPQKDGDGDAVSNIRERLKMTCRGDFSITTQGKITVVTIVIPKRTL